jgi:hypothetical protein
MVQNQRSGAAGNAFGRDCGRRVADALGARLEDPNSNRCSLYGKRVVIKCARHGTTSVGVTYKMLEEIDAVLGAFECVNGSFDLYLLGVAQYKIGMTQTRSKGPSSGKVAKFSKREFIDLGEPKGNLRI